jgi:hypothetical protein
MRLFPLADFMQSEDNQLGAQFGFRAEAVYQYFGDLLDARRGRLTSHSGLRIEKDAALGRAGSG